MAEVCNGWWRTCGWAEESSDLEAGFSGRPSPTGSPRRTASYRILGSSRRAPRFEEEIEVEERRRHHFLESCFLCKKQLGGNQDIFMYRGDTAFCSEECREKQMVMDEAKERSSRKLAVRMASRKDKAKAAAAQSIHDPHAGIALAG